MTAAHPEDEYRLATYRTNVLAGEELHRALVDKQRLKSFKAKTKPLKRSQNAPKSVNKAGKYKVETMPKLRAVTSGGLIYSFTQRMHRIR